MDHSTLEEIRRVKYRYLRCVDQKRWDEFAGTLTADATANYGTPAMGEPLNLAGRDAITAFMRVNLGPDIITTHFAGQPEIDVNGDQAAGTWCFEDTVISTTHNIMIRGCAFYEDRYRRDTDGAWRISHTGYTRTYEIMLNLAELPGFQLTANRWAEPVT